MAKMKGRSLQSGLSFYTGIRQQDYWRVPASACWIMFLSAVM